MAVLRNRCAVVVALLLPGLVGCPWCDLFHEPSTTSLDCEAGGYPCSLSEVPLDVLARGEQLADAATTMIEGGASIADAQAYLQAQDGVVEVASSEVALRFRLDGGRDVWILLGDALAPALDSSPPDASVTKPIVRAQHVVGETPESKHALVLSPFKFQFGSFDDGAAVAQVLAETRGYAGNVTYLENATETSATVGISQFTGWDDYDVIHVTSHGSTICDQSNCSAVIFTGDTYSDANDLLQITEAGVNTAHVVGDDAKRFCLSADFFRNQYPAGLERTIVFFNACRTYGAGDFSLGQAFLGDSSVFLGWSEVVESGPARDAALALYNDLGDNGSTITAAHAALGDLAVDHLTYKGQPIEAHLLLATAPGRDLRDREVVTLEHPVNGGELANGATVKAGGKANDGVVDLVPYQVRIDGVDPGMEEGFIVQVSVDGSASTPSTASIGERVGEKSYRLSGAFPYIDLDTQQTVEIVATLQLPEGGASVHRATIHVTTEEDDKPEAEVWVGKATTVYDSAIIGKLHWSITATFVFEQTEESIGKPYKYFTVREGMLKWSISGEIVRAFDDPCPYSNGPVEVPILPDDGRFRIDTTTSPPTYTFFGNTQGPEVRVATQCGDYAYTTRADGVWGYPVLNSDKKPVIGDSISGAAADNLQSWTWELTRQSAR